MEFTRPDFIEEIRREVRQTSDAQKQKNALRGQLERSPANALFRIKPADQWLKEECEKPPARQLLGTLWHENELCVLFADTNMGKSILAVQIGYELAKQCGMEPFGNRLPAPVKVLYIDFELTSAQFKSRYTDRQWGDHHFGEFFIRAEFNPQGDNPLLYDDYADYVQEKIAKAVTAINPQVLIVDNLTCMGSPTQHAGGALPLMKALKALKAKHNLSVLVLAHTPKRSPIAPITVNDLQGSKMIINFADSAFAIGQSNRDPDLRYIKQIKQRNTANDYGAEHVAMFRIGRELSYLHFKFEGYDNEQLHLQRRDTTAISDEIKQRIIELNHQGLSTREAGDHLRISASTVRRVLSKVKEEGVIG